MDLGKWSLPVVGIAILSGIPLPIRAQSTFDVATIKQSPPPDGDLFSINLGTIRNGKVTLTNTTLSDCIRFAYGLVSEDQISGPDWIKFKEVRFDIVAQAPPDTPREQLLRMLQALLADRLKLVLHHEQRERSFLALVVGKGGSKLRPASSDLGVAPGPMILGRIVSTQMSMLTGGLTIALRAADSHRYDGSPGSIRCRSAVDFGERRRTDDQRQAIHLHSRSRTTRPEA